MTKTNKFVMITLAILLCSSLLVGTLYLTGGVPSVTAETTGTNEVIKTITSTGEGAIKVTPDVAWVTVGVLSEHKELLKAQEDNTLKMNAVIKALTDSGVKKEDIQTTGYTVIPNYEWNQTTGKSNLIGYTVRNTVEVTINDLEKAGVILDKVVASGSNTINGIRFGVKDETTLYNKALEIAVKDAKVKAEAMAKGLGITNIEPLHITEVSNRYTPVYAEKGMLMDSVSSTPISLGELEVSASVNVEFSFK